MRQTFDLGHSTSLLIATSAISVLQVSVAISLAALIFAGDLEPALPTAAGAFILSGAITSLFIGWRSSLAGAASGAQDTAAVVFATVVGPSTAALTGGTKTATALVMVATSTLVIGVTFSLLGRFGMGSMVRYIPQPVVGGFLAGTGWLMLLGGLRVMLDRTIHLSSLPNVLEWQQLQRLLPGVVLAVFVVVAVARRFPPLSLSIGVVGASVLFYLGVRLFSSLDATESGGWLIGPFESSARWRPFTPSDFAATDWATILGQTPAFAAVALIAVVGLLLNLTALESVAGQDIDFDHEMKVAGMVNIVSGGLGGVSGWHRIGDSVLAHHLGVRTRIVPIGVGVLGITIMVAGSRVVELVPRAVAGGVLSGLGLALLWGWVVDYLGAATKPNKLLGIGILAGIATFGPLIGVGLGIVVAASLFVFQYSRIEPVRHQLSGRAVRSTVDRPPHIQTALDARTASTEIIVLDGYLFFGSATRTVESIRLLTTTDREMTLGSLIIDMKRVTGIDVSASSSLGQSLKRLAAHGVAVTISEASSEVKQSLLTGGLDNEVSWADTLDSAVETNEERLLSDLELPGAVSWLDQLNEELDGQAAALLDHCTVVELNRGELLMRSGERAESLFLIAQGHLSVMAPTTTIAPYRLRKTGPGAVLGEVAFATRGTRTADVVAYTHVIAHELTRQRWDELRGDNPALTTDFQAYLTRIMAGQLRARVEAMNELLR